MHWLAKGNTLLGYSKLCALLVIIYLPFMEIRRFSHGPHEERLCLTILLEAVEQWGKLCCLEGGDIMHAHDIVHKRMDGRDASRPCVNYCIVKCSLKLIHLYLFPNSMNNVLIETGAINTFQKSSSFKLLRATSVHRYHPHSQEQGN
jgi:hypothetical protein